MEAATGAAFVMGQGYRANDDEDDPSPGGARTEERPPQSEEIAPKVDAIPPKESGPPKQPAALDGGGADGAPAPKAQRKLARKLPPRDDDWEVQLFIYVANPAKQLTAKLEHAGVWHEKMCKRAGDSEDKVADHLVRRGKLVDALTDARVKHLSAAWSFPSSQSAASHIEEVDATLAELASALSAFMPCVSDSEFTFRLWTRWAEVGETFEMEQSVAYDAVQ